MARLYTTEEICKLIAEYRLAEFYNSRGWRRLRREILREQNNECQLCKARGKYTPAETVHHVKHLKDFPNLAYCRYYTDADGKQQRQLVAVCHNCHEREHGRIFTPKSKYTNVEKW